MQRRRITKIARSNITMKIDPRLRRPTRKQSEVNKQIWESIIGHGKVDQSSSESDEINF